MVWNIHAMITLQFSAYRHIWYLQATLIDLENNSKWKYSFFRELPE